MAWCDYNHVPVSRKHLDAMFNVNDVCTCVSLPLYSVSSEHLQPGFDPVDCQFDTCTILQSAGLHYFDFEAKYLEQLKWHQNIETQTLPVPISRPYGQERFCESKPSINLNQLQIS